MPDAITQLIADLKESKYSQAQQNIIVPVDDFVAALNEIEAGIGPGAVNSVNNTDTYLTIAPNTGAVVVNVDLATLGPAITPDLNLFTAIASGTVSASGGGTANFLRADGSWDAPPGTAGDVVGPAGAVANNFASFNGASGLIIKDSGSSPGSFDVAGAAAAAQAAAEAASDPSGSAATAQANAEAYTNAQLSGAGTISVPAISLPTGKIIKGDGSAHGSAVFDLADIVLVLDGGGVALASGARFNMFIDFACTITQVTVLADQSGSVNLDIQTCSYANYQPGTHPVSGDSITAADPPDISATYKYQDAALTGWTTAIAAGTCVSLTATGAATAITRVTCSLKVEKT